MEGDLSFGSSHAYLNLFVLFFCLLGVAFFSSAEASIIASNKLRIRHLAEQGDKAAQAVQRMLHRHEKFFAVILLTENALIIFASSFGTVVFLGLLGEGGQAVLVASVIITVVIVIFGEITPKSLAAQGADRWSLLVARPIEWIIRVETFVVYLFTLVPRLLQRAIFRDAKFRTVSVTEAELRLLVDIGEQEGVVERHEAEFIDKVFEFGDTQVREVMTPRVEIVGVEAGTTVQQFLGLFGEHTFARFPVYQEDLDHILGILYVKDVLRAMAQSQARPDTIANELMYSPLFVPETKPISRLFEEMRVKREQMALIVDEYGGVTGLVTLKQLMAELVGELEEETGAEEDFQRIDERTVQMDGTMRIDEANEKLNLGLSEGEYETVAGFMLKSLGHIPREGELVHHHGLQLVVRQMKGVKIEKVDVINSP